MDGPAVPRQRLAEKKGQSEIPRPDRIGPRNDSPRVWGSFPSSRSLRCHSERSEESRSESSSSLRHSERSEESRSELALPVPATAETTTRAMESRYPRTPIGHAMRDYGQLQTI